MWFTHPALTLNPHSEETLFQRSHSLPDSDRPAASAAPLEKPAAKSRDKRLSPDARRDAIMCAAQTLFLSKGYAATSLEEVVAQSGGSLSTVYQLFGNKQGLWEALVTQVSETITAPVQEAMAGTGTPRAVLREFANRLDALARAPHMAGALRLMLAEGLKYPDMVKGLFARGPDASIKILIAYLDAEVASGRLVIDDTALAAEQLRSLVCSDVKLRNACGVLAPITSEEIAKRLDAAVDMFLKVYGRA